MATLFFLVCLTLQCWRLFSLSATYDQALFLQELWSTAQGRPFESSLSSVLSGAVAVGDALPSVSYLHLGQHANALTLIGAPLVAWLGPWALPLLQVSALTVAGLVFWQLAASRLPAALAERLTAAYFLSGAVIGPALENFHDLIWLPLLGFLVWGLLERRIWQVVLFGFLLLLVREDSGLLLFSLGLWALMRQPGSRWLGGLLMVTSFAWVLLVTGWIQPLWIPRWPIAFCRRSSAIWWMTFRRDPGCGAGFAAAPPGPAPGAGLATGGDRRVCACTDLAASVCSVALGGCGVAGLGAAADRPCFARTYRLVGDPALRAGPGAGPLSRCRALVAAPSRALVQALAAPELDGRSQSGVGADPAGQPPPQPLSPDSRQFCALGACAGTGHA